MNTSTEKLKQAIDHLENVIRAEVALDTYGFLPPPPFGCCDEVESLYEVLGIVVDELAGFGDYIALYGKDDGDGDLGLGDGISYLDGISTWADIRD